MPLISHNIVSDRAL